MMDIKELSDRTNLSIPYIRKCLIKVKTHINKHVTRGDKNKLLFTDNALIIFDQISQLKTNGLAITEIQSRLNDELKDVTSSSKNVSNIINADQKNSNKIEALFETQLEDKNNQIIELKEKIEKHERRIEDLTNKILEQTRVIAQLGHKPIKEDGLISGFIKKFGL